MLKATAALSAVLSFVMVGRSSATAKRYYSTSWGVFGAGLLAWAVLFE